MKDSELLIPKEHNEGFRISDPLRAQERIQYFWSPKDSEFLILNNDTQKDSEFLIPYKDTQKDAESLISYKGTEKYSEFLIPQRTQDWDDSEFLISHWTGFRTFYPQRT